MRSEYEILGERVHLGAEMDGDEWRVDLPTGEAVRVKLIAAQGSVMQLRVTSDGEQARQFEAAVAEVDGELNVSFEGRVYRFGQPNRSEAFPRASSSSGALHAPMLGVVTDVAVGVGDRVAQGDRILVLEAMKVIATVEAPFAGRVTSLCVAKGDRVAAGTLVAVIEASREEASN